MSLLSKQKIISDSLKYFALHKPYSSHQQPRRQEQKKIQNLNFAYQKFMNSWQHFQRISYPNSKMLKKQNTKNANAKQFFKRSVCYLD